MRRVFVLSALVLPWLNPFTWGPAPSMVQWLFCAICTALLVTWQMTSVRPWRLAVPAEQAWLAQAWLAAAAASAVIGLTQYLGLTQWWGQWANTSALGEAYGNLRQRNQFATLLGIGMVAGLWLLARAGESATPGAAQRAQSVWVLAVLLLLGAANAASASRTGLLQLLLIVALSHWWTRQSAVRPGKLLRLAPWWVLLSYLVTSMVLPLLINLDPLHTGIFARFTPDAATACQSRMRLWSNVLHLIGQKPWWGWGWGELDYAHFMVLYPGNRFCDLLDNAHNLPLHLAVELGVPLAVLCCGVVLWLVWRSKPWLDTDRTRQMAWAVLGLLGLHSLLEYPLWYGPFQMALLLCVYLLWSTAAPRSKGAATVRLPRERTLPKAVVGSIAATALVGMVACLLVALDYWRTSQIYTAPGERHAFFQNNTLGKIQDTRLFQAQAQFAELGTTVLTPDNALHIHDLALEMLHFSPEPAVVRKLIASAAMLGRTDEVAYYTQRFHAAFPDQPPGD